MTPDERLDQLEPLLSEAMAILDRHTAQLKQHTNLLQQHTNLLHQLTTNTGHLLTIASQHSDSIGFLLQEQAEMKAEQAGIRAQQTSMDGKLDLILDKLGNLEK